MATLPTIRPEEVAGVIAGNLRALKALRQLSDAQLAQRMGAERSWVQERVSGVRECKASDVLRFALVFGVPVGRLYSAWDATSQHTCTRGRQYG